MPTAIATTEPLPVERKCATMAVHHRMIASDPEYVAARAVSENRARDFATRRGITGRAGVTVIPVVVHVVYKTPAQNISDAQIKSQIDVLNHDYRKTNADIANLPAVFGPLGADARIEFSMATTDPTGNPTDGINRIKTAVDTFTDDDGVKAPATGGVDAWPRDHYLNIWVCQLGNGLLGYAQFPGGAAATDGVVILHTAFGTTGTAAAPFNLGRSATHEIGHWLNLRHIWGDDGNGCNGTDFVNDTPNAAGPNGGKPAFPHVTCLNGPSGDLFMNYMDYTDDDTMYMFTNDQVTRMQAALDGDRASIGTSKPGPTPKFKFRDDPIGTLKFRDDIPKFKFRDDTIGTLKFRDDIPKFKFRDDPIGTLKFADDGQQKSPSSDIPGVGPPPVVGDPAPFVLATPHHSRAWTRSFPDAFEATISSYETQLGDYEALLSQYADADAAGSLSDQDRVEADRLYDEYLQLAAEYQHLTTGSPPAQ